MSRPVFSIVCQRPGCGTSRLVPDRRAQRVQRYCSPECRGIMQRRTVPLFIVCQRCGAIKPVPLPSVQRTQRYCSRRCAASVTQNIRKAGRIGIERSVAKRRRHVLTRVAGLTPVQAFRLGYVRGLQSKLRQIRQRFTLVKKAS